VARKPYDPVRVLEDPSIQRHSLHVPRASLLLAADEAANSHTEIWMGGAHSLIGEPLESTGLGASWLVDCAGDIDRAYRDLLARFLPCVFPDLDGPLASSNRVSATVEEVLSAVTSRNGEAPDRVYVMCQHGMNRSGLVSGLILRGLGVEPREAVDRIRLARPGALANDYFRQLLLRG
jgi:hypothetical protein